MQHISFGHIESFDIDIEHYLQKIADDRRAQLEHQKNAPRVSM